MRMSGWRAKGAVPLLALWALVAVLWRSEAQACVICVPYPTVTHADVLLNSEIVVMARENPDKPFSFIVTEILKGEVDRQPSELLLDSQTRRRLNLNPSDRVILYRNGADAKWARLTYADVAYQEIISEVLERTDIWPSHGNSSERVAYFSQLLNRSHRTIRSQAYLEVGRAPYSRIREVAQLVPREEMRQFLSDWRLIEWHRLYILMLGNSGHPDDRAYIRDRFESAAKSGISRNLSAWTVAFIETNPDSALGEIEELFFRGKGRSFEELEAVLQGISVAAESNGGLALPHIAALRRQATLSFEALLDSYPHMAGYVARDLTIWKHRALVDRLTRISESKVLSDPGSAYARRLLSCGGVRLSGQRKRLLDLQLDQDAVPKSVQGLCQERRAHRPF